MSNTEVTGTSATGQGQVLGSRVHRLTLPSISLSASGFGDVEAFSQGRPHSHLMVEYNPNPELCDSDHLTSFLYLPVTSSFFCRKGRESYILTAWICEHKSHGKRSKTQAAAVLPTKNVNAKKQSRLMPSPLGSLFCQSSATAS